MADTGQAGKRTLRRQARRARAAMGVVARASATGRVVAHVLDSVAWSQAGCVAGYVAVGDELDPRALLSEAHARGKRVALPRVEAPGEMSLRDWSPGQALVPGALGILEPAADTPVVKPDAVGLYLLPGLAFDAHGGRLGYGGGFYDRLLAHAPDAVRMGLCFAVQRVVDLPVQDHDVRVQWLVTEEGVTRCG